MYLHRFYRCVCVAAWAEESQCVLLTIGREREHTHFILPFGRAQQGQSGCLYIWSLFTCIPFTSRIWLRTELNMETPFFEHCIMKIIKWESVDFFTQVSAVVNRRYSHITLWLFDGRNTEKRQLVRKLKWTILKLLCQNSIVAWFVQRKKHHFLTLIEH